MSVTRPLKDRQSRKRIPSIPLVISRSSPSCRPRTSAAPIRNTRVTTQTSPPAVRCSTSATSPSSGASSVPTEPSSAKRKESASGGPTLIAADLSASTSSTATSSTPILPILFSRFPSSRSSRPMEEELFDRHLYRWWVNSVYRLRSSSSFVFRYCSVYCSIIVYKLHAAP